MSAKEWLEAHGIVARTPTIRSSDYNLALTDPFHYYLTRRLGLGYKFAWSQALTAGSWWHLAFELDDFGSKEIAFTSDYNRFLDERLKELGEICKSSGIIGESREKFVNREKEEAETVLAWYKAASTIPLTMPQDAPDWLKKLVPDREYPSFRHFFNVFKPIGRELRITVTNPWAKALQLVAQFDRLLYNEKTNTLWIADAKTCTGSCWVRASTCPIEFQPQHYLFVLKRALESGILREQFPSLPKDVKIGGMIHLIISKPQIRLSGSDRNFTEVEHTFQRGKRKGETETRKEYYGDPQWENYIKRCRDWYRGTGDYSHEADSRVRDPMVLVSWTPLEVALPNDDQYEQRVGIISRWATETPWPARFPSNPNTARFHGSLTKWAPFYLTPVRDWPEIIQQEDMMVSFRDEDLIEQEPE